MVSPPQDRDGQTLVMVLALGATIVCAAPIFLTGALSPLVGADLGLGVATVGIAATAFFVASAAVSMLSGRVAERLGARSAAVLGLAACSASFAALGAAPSAGAFGIALVLAGIGNGLVQPSANLVLLRFVAPSRLGTAFGLKQAAIPLAALGSGVAIPALAVDRGWRVTYAVFAMLALAVLIGLRLLVGATPPDGPPGRARPRGPGRVGLERDVLLALLLGFLAAAGIASLAVFLVRDLVRIGIDLGAAGVILAAGSLLGAVSRLVAGTLRDRARRLRGLTLVRAMIAVGGLGLLLMSASRPWAVVLGGLVAFTAGWGWNGVYHLAYLESLPDSRRERLAGFAQSAVFLGGAVGPLGFGLVAERSFPAAWALSAACLLLGSAVRSGGPAPAASGVTPR